MTVLHLSPRPLPRAHPHAPRVSGTVLGALLALVVLLASAVALLLAVEQLTRSGVITLAPAMDADLQFFV